jgi:short-subunit dehydrogenase
MASSAYALVTGASSGIGACFARALAARGHNLVLVARSTSKLQELVRHLASACSVHAEPTSLDLSEAGAATRLAATLRERGLAIDLLVNNAGFGARGRFWELPLDRQAAMLRLNVQAVVELTHLLLPPMIEARRGAIITVSSTAGFQAVPYTSVYGATKAFLTSFSEGLAEELRPYGITVVTLCPGGTRTNFHVASNYGRPPLPGGMQNPEAVVRAALAALDRGGGTVVPGVMNKLALVSQRLIPRRLVAKVTARIFFPE